MNETMFITDVRALFAVVSGTLANLNTRGCLSTEDKRSLELACKLFTQEVDEAYNRQQAKLMDSGMKGTRV